MGGASSIVEHAVSSAAQKVGNTVTSTVKEVANPTATIFNATTGAVNDVSNFTKKIVESGTKEVFKKITPRTEEHHDSRTQEELERAKIEQEQLRLAIEALEEELNNKEKLETENDLDQYQERTIEEFYALAKEVPSLTLTGRNIGFFGITSIGKSSMINTLLGAKLAAVGIGETTKEITPYDGLDYRLYDFPGKNDDMSSFNKSYIALLKGLTHRMVLIGATLKEMSKLLCLLDVLNLNYDIVINKFDSIEVEERESFLSQILEEIQDGQFKGVHNVWCVSARNPEQFPGWLEMMNYLTS
ncbi:unnamed protein product [Rotaria sp. Silwood2]|nr:unnamed protein product [Rotaria sp. Silwood2]CAF4286429.1 unnamed protein product [Rotaria sp. Silwood2]